MPSSFHSRRAFVQSALLAAAAPPALVRAATDSTSFTSPLTHYRDPATEFEIVRITEPDFASVLPPSHLRAAATRSNSLLFATDRWGSWQACRIDLKSGEARQLTAAAELDPQTLSLLPDERNLIYFDGRLLQVAAASSGAKPRTAYKVDDAWTRSPGFAVTENGVSAIVTESAAGKYRFRLASITRPLPAATILESPEPLALPLPRPRRPSFAYLRGGQLFLAGLDGRTPKKLRTPSAGEILAPVWSADGKVLHYLFQPEDRTRLVQLRETLPDSDEDKLISNTSQFANFARNGNSTVFAGVSRNRASAHILLLLRVTRRELTIAEHRATEPSKANVLFAPNSQRLIYQTDRHGKPCLYLIHLERFVEKTESEPALTN